MSVSPKVRFEVFKRDNFTCRYCGYKTPKVILEVDHVIPRSKGGPDEINNLVTSCWECNRGKGATLLSDIPNEPSLHDKTILMLEREMQLAEFNEIKRRIREREDNQIDELLAFWDDLASGHARQFPEIPTLRRYLKVISVEDIKNAMEIAFSKKSDWVGVNYLYGILRNWKNDSKSRKES